MLNKSSEEEFHMKKIIAALLAALMLALQNMSRS